MSKTKKDWYRKARREKEHKKYIEGVRREMEYNKAIRRREGKSD